MYRSDGSGSTWSSWSGHQTPTPASANQLNSNLPRISVFIRGNGTVNVHNFGDGSRVTQGQANENPVFQQAPPNQIFNYTRPNPSMDGPMCETPFRIEDGTNRSGISSGVGGSFSSSYHQQSGLSQQLNSQPAYDCNRHRRPGILTQRFGPRLNDAGSRLVDHEHQRTRIADNDGQWERNATPPTQERVRVRSTPEGIPLYTLNDSPHDEDSDSFGPVSEVTFGNSARRNAEEKQVRMVH